MSTRARPNACEWAEANWRLPNGALIKLRPWQREVLLAMFPADGSQSPYETFLISTVKKAGKTTLDAVATLYATLTFPAPETGYVVANDEAQAQERVFELIDGAVRKMGWVANGKAKVTKREIVFPETGSKLLALPADFAGSAGAAFGITSWTELWAFRHENHIRLWEEMTPVPNRRSLRIVDTYAGFTGDAPVLEPLWERALKGTQIHPDLPIYTNGKLWAFIDQGPEAQQRAWLGSSDAEREAYYAEQAESLRPGTYARLHLNQWQSGEEAFITAEDWDACVDRELQQEAPALPQTSKVVAVGLDGATKRDCSAVVAVARDQDNRYRLVAHRIWKPRKGEPVDLEVVEEYLLQLASTYTVRSITFDPTQLEYLAGQLKKRNLPMHELTQTTDNLTRASQTLYDVIKARKLRLYENAELRAHALNAVAVENPRGWKLAKEKSSKKIDGVVALSFASLGALGLPVFGVPQRPRDPSKAKVYGRYGNEGWVPATTSDSDY